MTYMLDSTWVRPVSYQETLEFNEAFLKANSPERAVLSGEDGWNEHLKAIEEMQLLIKIALGRVSIELLAQSFDTSIREIVRCLQWTPQKRYRKPSRGFINWIHFELSEDLASRRDCLRKI